MEYCWASFSFNVIHVIFLEGGGVGGAEMGTPWCLKSVTQEKLLCCLECVCVIVSSQGKKSLKNVMLLILTRCSLLIFLMNLFWTYNTHHLLNCKLKRRRGGGLKTRHLEYQSTIRKKLEPWVAFWVDQHVGPKFTVFVWESDGK